MNFSNASLPTTQLVLDSKYASFVRDNGATAGFPIADGVDSPTEFHSAHIQLLQFQAFNTIYNINDTNCTLEIFVQTYNQTFTDLNSSNTSTLVTIPQGSYTSDTLVSALNTAILSACTTTQRSANSGAGSSLTSYYYYSGFGISSTNLSAGAAAIDPVSFSATTGKITFQIPSLTDLADTSNAGTYSSATGIASNTYFASHIYSGFYLLTNTYTGLLKTLGFDTSKVYDLPTYNSGYRGVGVLLAPTVTSSTNLTVTYAVNTAWQLTTSQSAMYTVSTSGNVTSPKLLDLSYPRSLNIIASGIPTNNRSVTPNLSYGNLFANIPITVGFGDVISYEPMINFPLQITNFQLNQFVVSVLDEDGQPINFQNTKWKLVIGINWSYDLGAAGEQDVYQGREVVTPYHFKQHDKLYKRRRY